MCLLCPGTIAGCEKIECGALPRIDENGKPRKFYMRWYELRETPCDHVMDYHKIGCVLFEGDYCDCKYLGK